MRGEALVLAVLATALSTSACAHPRSEPPSDLGPAARQAVIEAGLDELQQCRSDLPPEQRGAKGSLLFDVDLRRNGTVEWVSVTVDELGSPKLTACAVRRIKRWRFPQDRRRRSIRFGVGFG